MVSVTVPIAVGVPLILSVLVPVLETEMPSEMSTGAPVVGITVPFTVNT